MKIYIAECDKNEAEVILKTAQAKYPKAEVSLFDTGASLLNRVKASSPDIVFVGTTLPDKDGALLGYILKNEFKGINIILVSDELKYSDEAKFLQNSPFIEKPVSKEKILEALDSASRGEKKRFLFFR